MTTLIDGKAFAAQIRTNLTQAVAKLSADHNLTPGLAVVLVGEDPASQVYVRNKSKQCEEVGMRSFQHTLPATTPEADLLAKIKHLNADPQIHGILVQLPLPKTINEAKVIDTISIAKDVDGFHQQNVGKLWTGAPTLAPCTPTGCLLLLQHQFKTQGGLSGKHAIVVGRSNIVGKPLASLLLQANCTVTIAHSRTQDLPAECRRADILIAAVGVPEIIKGDWVKPGATIIDVGINRITTPDGKTKLVGDVEFATAEKVAHAITPVPGGVGPMTIACLLRNTLLAAYHQHSLPIPQDL